MGLLDLYDDKGVVVDQMPEDTDDDSDELESVLNPKVEVEKEPEESEGTEEVAPEEEGEGEEETKEPSETEPETAPEPDDDEASRLRRLSKRQERELAFLKARLERLEKNVITEPDEGEEAEVPARIEQLQGTINRIAQEKGPAFEILLEAMAQTPKYADIEEVCTQDNFNDLVSIAAERIAADEGRDPVEVALELEADVWQRRNPYSYMYDLIKEHHPRFTKKADAQAAGKEKETGEGEKPPVEKTKKTLADAEKLKAPSTIADAGTGTKTSLSGWTAKRIDEMDEMELDKVPAEVYEKYLQGALD